MGGVTEIMLRELQAIILRDYALEVPSDQAMRIGEFLLSFYSLLASVELGQE
jgi:hypothetical protein